MDGLSTSEKSSSTDIPKQNTAAHACIAHCRPIMCYELTKSRNGFQLRYDTVEEFNVDSKAETIQLNLAHV